MIARVFPRRTAATPVDFLAFVGEPTFFQSPEISEVYVSVTFTWDIPESERLARAWSRVAPVKIGGPALGDRGGNFEPGKYLKTGYVVTSRGCPNSCWFCSVPKREGGIRELPITEGSNLLDDNILACSESHIKSVFAMMRKHPGRQFTGGLEAKRLQKWHADGLWAIRPKQVFFAYDTPDDWEPLENAAGMMFSAGFTRASKCIRAYCLVGFPKDNFEDAGKRLNRCLSIGVLPMPMLWRDETGKVSPQWQKFLRPWMRPAMMRWDEIGKEKGK